MMGGMSIHTREIVVQFNADVADGMQWKFTPTQRQVFFYIDPEFETDPRMDGINNLILSCTFFRVSEENTTDTNSSVPVQETN